MQAPSICDLTRSVLTTRPASQATSTRGTETLPSLSTLTCAAVATYVVKLRCTAKPIASRAGNFLPYPAFLAATRRTFFSRLVMIGYSS
jgi:hypothetical protein